MAKAKDKEVDWRNDPVFTEEEMEELDDQFDPCAHGRKLR